MITVTSLKHPKTKRKLMKASCNAMRWGIDHVRREDGRAFLAIRYNSSINRFHVLDGKGRDVTETVAQAI